MPRSRIWRRSSRSAIPRRVRPTTSAILEDPSIQLITTAAIANERAAIGIAAMQHGKDVLSDKPGFTTFEQLAEARQIQAATGRIYAIC
jgi:predicted dehydrogenase